MITEFGMGDVKSNTTTYAKFYYDPIRDFCSLPQPRLSARRRGQSDSAIFWFFLQPTDDYSFTMAGRRNFTLFCCCDLDLDPVTLLCELDPYSLDISPQTTINFLRQGCRNMVLHTYRHTDRCHLNIAMAASWVVTTF